MKRNFKEIGLFLFFLFISITIQKSIKPSKDVPDYNKVPEYMANYYGQGHKLDCLSICKRCINDTIVAIVYYRIKDSTSVKFIPKEELDHAINQELALLKKEKEDEYHQIVQERIEINENELNPNNLFRIYYDQCILYNNYFYA